jgi:hypothetical protein
MVKVFANVGKNPLNVDIEEIFTTLLVSKEGVSLGELLDRFKHSVRKEELIEVLDTLVTIGKVKAVAGRYMAVR